MNPSSFEQVRSPAVAPPSGAFSHATVVPLGDARLVFVSGQVPVDAAGALVGEGDMEAQTEQVFRNLELVLRECGCDLQDVVKITSFVTDTGARAAFSKVRNRVFARSLPASTFVEVSALVNPKWLVEIEAVAVARAAPGP